MPQIKPTEPAYLAIVSALKSKLINQNSNTKEIRLHLGPVVSALNADQIKYRVKKAIEDEGIDGDQGKKFYIFLIYIYNEEQFYHLEPIYCSTSAVSA